MSTAPPPPADAPRVLLFGHAGAGKSALLGALLRAGETQGPTLRGEVVEASGRLATIRDAVYRGGDLGQPDAEITSYVVRLRPWREGTRAVTDPVTIVLNDCSGKAAELLIKHPDALHDSDATAPAARAVIDADAIVLLVDASSNDEELQEAFEEFDTFLTVVAQGKASARDVGGFPVLLVLTQCDRLAVPGDTRAQWEARVNARTDRAWAKFDAFLKDADPEDGIPSPFLPFGSVDLTVYAVAVRVPKLRYAPDLQDSPFQVAELFRDAFHAAKTHRDRVAASDRRLKWTVRSSLSVLAAMLLGVVAVVAFQPSLADPGLAEKVAAYQTYEQDAAVRLTEPNLTRNKLKLQSFRDDNGFRSLAEEQRAFVASRLKEIEDYEAYRGRLTGSLAPGDTRSLEELEQVEKALTGELGLPPQYAWVGTPAAQLRDKWLADARAIRTAEAAFLKHYQDLIRRGTLLAETPGFGGPWRPDANTLLAEGERPPAPLDAPVPDSPTVAHPRGKPVTNRDPFNFDRVRTARNEWVLVADRLTNLRDLADALGLTVADKNLAVLDLTTRRKGEEAALQPGKRWADLPGPATGPRDFTGWQLGNFFDPGRKLLDDRLDASFQVGANAVKGLIRAQLGPTPAQQDSPRGWRALAATLRDVSTPYPEWGRLLHLVARLRKPAAPDPVRDLADFLERPTFTIDLGGAGLELPRNLIDEAEDPRPDGPFAVTVTPRPGDGEPVTKRYAVTGGRSGSVMKFTLAAVPEGGGKLSYTAGAELRAELPLRAGDQRVNLVWESGGPVTFQFARLAREPRIERPGGRSAPATGVKLTPRLGADFPRLPELFPDIGK